MPNNAYPKTERRVQLAIQALKRLTDLADIVTRIDGGVFVGALGDTVHHRLEAITRARDYEWRTRTAPIVMDEIFTNEISVALTTHTYSGNKFTDEEEKLDLESYSRQILGPQVKAVTGRLNGNILLALQAAPFKITNLNPQIAGAGADDALDWALDAQSQLDAQGTPDDERLLIVGASVFNWLARSGKVVTYDTSQATNVFRKGIFGEIAGFTVRKHTGLGVNDIYALHKSWAVMANVAPVVPAGATWGARVQGDGYGMRVIRDYDPNYLSDRSVVSTFTGISSVNDEIERHDATTAAAATAAGDSVRAGDPVVNFTTKKLVLTGDNVRGAKGVATTS